MPCKKSPKCFQTFQCGTCNRESNSLAHESCFTCIIFILQDNIFSLKIKFKLNCSRLNGYKTKNKLLYSRAILGDPGADRGGNEKSKRAKVNGEEEKHSRARRAPGDTFFPRAVPNSRGNSEF